MRVELNNIENKSIKICEDSIPFEYEIKIIADNKEEANILAKMEPVTWKTGWDKKRKIESIMF